MLSGRARLGVSLVAVLVVGSGPALSAEGAFSHFLPGTAGDIAIAQSPEPGLQVADQFWIHAGNIGAAVLQGQVNLDLDLTMVLNIAAASYTVATPIEGLTFSVGTAIPFGYANLDTTLVGPLGGRFDDSENALNLSDIAIIPFQLNWSYGDFSFKFAEAIVAPTGAYDVDEEVNLGRNYWSFDTVAAATWFDTEMGTEVSVAPGIMVNTRNDETDYRTGAEFHVDFTANQFVSETFALGLRGYYYRQVSGDTGSGAILGEFKGESLGIGPGFLWTPKFAGGRLAVIGKWMHDVKAENRFKADIGTIGAAWKF